VSGPIAFLNDATWLNLPAGLSHDDDQLTMTTGTETDFWRDTFYGFRRDNGHFFGAVAPSDFTAHVTFEGDYTTLYDQAGLMLRLDAKTWLKAGIEYSDGMTNFSTVITRGGSDWSVVAVPAVSGPQRLRLTRQGKAVLLHFLNVRGDWQMMRVADFPATAGAQLGPMACSPKRGGFTARFTEFTVGPVTDQPLH
jgi:uncharacterized protein